MREHFSYCLAVSRSDWECCRVKGNKKVSLNGSLFLRSVRVPRFEVHHQTVANWAKVQAGQLLIPKQCTDHQIEYRLVGKMERVMSAARAGVSIYPPAGYMPCSPIIRMPTTNPAQRMDRMTRYVTPQPVTVDPPICQRGIQAEPFPLELLRLAQHRKGTD